MIYWNLFIGFLKVGCFSFGGGYAAISLIRDVVHSYGWLSDDALTYMIAVSESTPGPIMINLATYVGSSQAGIPGALAATLAVSLPAFFIILLVTAVLKTLLKNRYVQALMDGMNPCVIGIILATGIYMTATGFLSPGSPIQIQPKAALITAFLAAAMFGSKRILKKKLSPIRLILLSALCGILVYGI